MNISYKELKAIMEQVNPYREDGGNTDIYNAIYDAIRYLNAFGVKGAREMFDKLYDLDHAFFVGYEVE